MIFSENNFVFFLCPYYYQKELKFEVLRSFPLQLLLTSVTASLERKGVQKGIAGLAVSAFIMFYSSITCPTYRKVAVAGPDVRNRNGRKVSIPIHYSPR